MKTKLSSYLCLGFSINALIDQRPDLDLTFEEIHDAADQKRLIALLEARYGDIEDFSFLHGSSIASVEEMETALSDAASGFYHQERRKAGVESSGLCLVIAILFQAIGNQFPNITASPRPEPRHELAPASAAGPGGLSGTVAHRQPGSGRLTLSDLLQVLAAINSLADSGINGEELPLASVHEAVREGTLLGLLRQFSGRALNLGSLQSSPVALIKLNRALSSAAESLLWRQFAMSGVSRNGYCLAAAIVIEAIRQKLGAKPGFCPVAGSSAGTSGLN